MGYNVYDPFRKELKRLKYIESGFMDTHFSHEVGFRYYLIDPVKKPKYNVSASFALRTISGKADFFNIGLNLIH